MRFRRTIVAILSTIFCIVARGWAQNALYPYQVSLYSQVSAETNGMGGAGVSFVSDNALAVIANPAELGLFSLHRILGASYMPPIPNQLGAFAVNAGMDLHRLWNTFPVRIGLGVGYSNPNYDYAYSGGAESLLANSVTTDAANGVTVALGVDYFVRLGLGYTFKWATTEETGGFRGYYKSTYTPDWGALLQIPVADIILNSDGSFTRSIIGATPILNLTFGYSERNFGNYTPGGLPGLPREGDLGWNFQFGLETSVAGHRWNWLSFTWIRQVDAPLVFNGTKYDQGLGSFKVFDNLFAGRPTGSVSIGKGWQVQIGQFLYFRAGSATGPEIPTYTTFGGSLRLDGLIKGLIFTDGISAHGAIERFLLDHLDLLFDFSEANGKIVGYRYATGFKGEPFESLTLVIK
jgi:hypothetical protein